MRLTTRALAGLLLVGVVALAGCGGSEEPAPPAKQRVVLAGLNTSDSEVAGELYRRLLDRAGFSTTVKEYAARELYLEPLEAGDVQVAADYASTVADALDEGGEPAGSPDQQTALGTLAELASDRGLTVLQATRAEVGTQYVMTAALARQWGVRTLSQLGAAGKRVSLAAAPDCLPTRRCTAGLEETYGIRLDRVAPLEGDTLTALRGGTVQLAQVTSTDPALDSGDLVVLQDDKSLVNAENLVPLANSAWLEQHASARTALDSLAPVLTTADLRRMVDLVARQGRPVGEVVQEYLSRKGLV